MTLYINNYVKKMVAAVDGNSFDNYLLIAGDISFNFEISELFYMELIKSWNHRRIIVVLGNHELWAFDENGMPDNNTHSVEQLVQCYRNLFTGLEIRFLHNDLLLFSRNATFMDNVLITEKKLQEIEPDKLKEICLKSTFAVLGGLGFSGLNPDFNAKHGIYRSSIQSFNEDIEHTKRFEYIYNKLNNTLGDNNVIILTHTPKENWSKEIYNSNWIYVNGHTHRNGYCINEKKTVYSDNQIGYYTNRVGLKYFSITKQYDIFRYYSDGIFNISREQYLDFNQGMGIHLDFNRMGVIQMLKKQSIYCFLYNDSEIGTLYLLNGGRLTKLKHGNPNYYFERMVYYSNIIKDSFKAYNQALKSISNVIRQVGGEGTVHGCIVDIDFYNHIYLNPIDGSVTPYFALSITEKIVYPDFQTLLLGSVDNTHPPNSNAGDLNSG